MIELTNAEERTLWDAVYAAAISANLWDHHVRHETLLGCSGAKTRDEHAAYIADKALVQRRMRTQKTNEGST